MAYTCITLQLSVLRKRRCARCGTKINKQIKYDKIKCALIVNTSGNNDT